MVKYLLFTQPNNLKAELFLFVVRHETRRNKVKNVCQKYGSILHRPDAEYRKNYILEFPHSLAYCLIGKVKLKSLKNDNFKSKIVVLDFQSLMKLIIRYTCLVLTIQDINCVIELSIFL